MAKKKPQYIFQKQVKQLGYKPAGETQTESGALMNIWEKEIPFSNTTHQLVVPPNITSEATVTRYIDMTREAQETRDGETFFGSHTGAHLRIIAN